MRRAPALALAWAWLLAGVTPGAAHAGSVVLLRSGELAAYGAAADGFRRAHSGPIVDLLLTRGDPNDLQRTIAHERPDCVVAVGLRAALFVRDRLPRVPIVYCAVQNPEEHDLAGAWITGVRTEVAPEAELAALLRAVPDAKRIGLFFGTVAEGRMLERARAAAAQSGIELVEARITGLGDLAHSARELAPRVDALWMPADPVLASPEAFRFLLDLSLRMRRPLFVFSDALVRAGAYAGLEPNFEHAGALAEQAVQRIKAGERAGDIPVAREKEARLVINQSTARALGREVPRGLSGPVEVLP